MTTDHDACTALAAAWNEEPAARGGGKEAVVCICGHAWDDHLCGGGCLFVVEDRDDEHWHPVFCACRAVPPADNTGRAAIAAAGSEG